MKPPCIVHVVMGTQGDYDLRRNWRVAAYETQALATEHLDRLNAQLRERIAAIRVMEGTADDGSLKYYALLEDKLPLDPNAPDVELDYRRDYKLTFNFVYSSPDSMAAEHAALMDLAREQGLVK